MKKIILFILTILVVLGIFKVNEQNIFIPDNSIRLRVIPNSNSPEDIYIKERVKDYLETNVYLLTKDSKNVEEARSILKENIPSIEDNINIIFTNNKY
ncbi:MAG: stage II sporulation protein R, partial [Bacilli bacterium]|nr:stage II sporulation protein R [Bacilli bacterium]